MSYMGDILKEYGVYRKGRMREDDIDMDGEDEFSFNLGDEDDEEQEVPDLDDEENPRDMDDSEFDYDDDGDLGDHEEHHDSVEDRLDDLEAKLTQVLNQMTAVVADNMEDDDDDDDGELFDPDDQDADVDDDGNLDLDDDDENGDDKNDGLDFGDDEEKLEYADNLRKPIKRNNADYEVDGDFKTKPYGLMNNKMRKRRKERYKKHRVREDLGYPKGKKSQRDDDDSTEDLQQLHHMLWELGAARGGQQSKAYSAALNGESSNPRNIRTVERILDTLSEYKDEVSGENRAIALMALIDGTADRMFENIHGELKSRDAL